MTNKVIRQGWEIYFHPELFKQQYDELAARVEKLKEELKPEDFKTHATVKLFAALTIGILEKIPSDPFASHFALVGALKGYSRMKKMGLPGRYRLFFRVFDTAEMKAIVILWLGYPRKEGDKNDCYTVFTKMVERGEFPKDLNELIADTDI
ncbi:type II toxin-antitoxin system YhaV family toxin [Chamaesiphon polymorphus]|uniref:Endonuclease n=1 Tax=Chamaesiphon polymorphus CCALA 037 TaxID=2107692 RepID=A0A2T1GF48_9CYAN|nr:type II toxin-antitoxin system YhaV family toxin [Chamaesiphon polymorphus]PSB56157.1 endonuclease [Chamaesiphon polymorphus CCALA 037]